jgi:antitoxin CptB
MTEDPAHRLKRLKMRSMRRGIKEMDLILTAYADAHLSDMDEAGLQLYDRLLDENDPDLYKWVTGQADPPAPFLDLMTDISQTLQNKT